MTTTIDPPAIRLSSSADQEQWHFDRSEGVTASEIRSIMSGGRRTWRRILGEKMNGAKHFVTRHTRRGHEREPFILDWLAENVATLEPNSHLFAALANPKHRCTPDATGLDPNDLRRTIGAEVKSHDFGYTRTTVPPDHYDQCQWNMHVLGADRWLYAWEVMGEDGEPTLDDPFYLWIDRDDARIAVLAEEADRFIEWRDAGAPESEDLPEDLDDAIAEWGAAKADKAAAEKREKAAEVPIRAFIAEQPDALVKGDKRAGTRGGYTYTANPKTVLDVDKWAEKEPLSYQAYLALQARVAETEEAALKLYFTKKTSTTLRYTPAGKATK